MGKNFVVSSRAKLFFQPGTGKHE